MKRFNINTKKNYTKDGEEKTAWNRVGTLVFFPKTENKEAGFKLELHMFPDTQFFLFEEKPKEEPTPF